jgi:hypothetical protein
MVSVGAATSHNLGSGEKLKLFRSSNFCKKKSEFSELNFNEMSYSIGLLKKISI